MLKNFVSKCDYDDYNEFVNNFKINMPKYFNFAYDVVDEIAKKEPDKLAMVWCDDNGSEKFFTFEQIKTYSNKAANFFKSLGIKKGDPVMLILKEGMSSGFVFLVYINWVLFLFQQPICLQLKILYIDVTPQM